MHADEKPHPIIDCYTHPQTCSKSKKNFKVPLVAKVLLQYQVVAVPY